MNGPVRPYVITGGRSRPRRDVLAVESLVSTVPGTGIAPEALNREQEGILALCGRLLSVAEIAAHLGQPIGIVKVLVGDLWELGAVRVRPPAPRSDRLPTELLEEVLVGLRQLR